MPDTSLGGPKAAASAIAVLIAVLAILALNALAPTGRWTATPNGADTSSLAR
ncbi:hypothetical protein ACFQ4O_09885 [Methylopila musalis]|uniref:Uncharacterized protein n=1 Tax=Methylopila musalis TaxID=1134781 RepID=A0ABW3Z7M8_9HYPH